MLGLGLVFGAWLLAGQNYTYQGTLIDPPAQSSALIDYTHRTDTVLAAPFLTGALFIAWRRLRRLPWLFTLALFSVGLFVAQIDLGAVIALSEFPARWTPAAHLFLSLGLISMITFSLAAGYHLERSTGAAAEKAALSFRSPFFRLLLVVFFLFFLLMVSGSLVSAQQSQAACPSWPLCGVDFNQLDTAGWIHLIHCGTVALSGLAAGLLLLRAWVTQRSQTAVLVSSTAAVVLFFAQALLGSQLNGDIPAYLLGLHQATSIAAWISLSILVASVGLARRTKEAEQNEALSIRGRKGLAFGVALLPASFYLLTAFVNFTAALLSLAGMIY